MAAQLERPLDERELLPADAGPGPGRVGREPRQRAHVELEDLAIDRHGVLDAHHELEVQRPVDLVGVLQGDRLKDHRQVERLDLRLDAECLHLRGQPVHEVGRVVVDAGRKIDRAAGQRCHVGAQMQHAAALAASAGSAARRDLRDHARAVGADAVEHERETLGRRGRRFVVVAHVQVHERGAGFVGGLRRLDLLGDRDRHCRVVLLARQRPSDRHRDDAGRAHGLSPRFSRAAAARRASR